MKTIRSTPVLAGLAVLTTLAAGCGGGGGGGSSSTSSKQAQSLSGAGSTLVAPLVSIWAQKYQPRTGTKVSYNPIGSGGGIQAISSRQVDFGASDAPLTSSQKQQCGGCVQIPWALAATLLSYDVKGAPNQLKLSGPVIADMFLGKIESWNDPAIAKLNPGVPLPSTAVTPVFRSDGSGDTYAFTDYLSKVSPTWKSKIGNSTSVNFPTGKSGKGNSGVAAVIGRTDGSIGYLAIAYVLENKLNYALVENAAGDFPVPGVPSIAAAAQEVTKLRPDNTVSITDPPASAPQAYPISTFTYAIVPGQTSKAAPLRGFLRYAIGPGQDVGRRYEFAPLPPAVVAADRSAIAKIHP